jgi:hypothetical protein
MPFDFHLWNEQGADDEPLFLKEKRRRHYCSIRRGGNGTGAVAVGSFASISSVANWIGEYGRFLLLFPEVEVTASLGCRGRRKIEEPSARPACSEQPHP